MVQPAGGAKVDPELRARLLGQRKAMGSGFIINNTNFSKGILHIMPAKKGETPGVKYTSLYCRSLKLGTTSPKTFGLKCPITDYKDRLNRTNASKEERDAAFKACGISDEYWMAVVFQDDLGLVESPALKIFRAKQRVYDLIIGRMVDEDIGEDITDLLKGRPCLVKKTGSEKDTKWTIDFLDRQPVSDDPDYIEALRSAVEGLNISQKFYRVDWDKLAKIYAHVTGEEMDESYRTQDGADAGITGEGDDHAGHEVAPETPATTAKPATLAPKGATKPAAPAPAAPAPKGPVRRSPPPPPPPAEPEPDVNGIICGVTKVSFDFEGKEAIGIVTKFEGPNADGDDTYDVAVPAGEHGEGSWSVKPEEMTLVEEDDNAAAQPEPEPPPAPKGPQRKTAPPAPAPAETAGGGGDAATGEQTEAAEVPKPAARTVKPAAAKVTPPAAPAPKGPAGPATSSLRNRVKTK